MDDRELRRILESLSRPRILIVGDLILDRYLTGDVSRISPEAPIPVLAAKHSEERLGGAGNVAANLRAAEAEVEIVGVLGDDDGAQSLRRMLKSQGVEVDGCYLDPSRPTTRKTRLVSGVQQMLRVDWEENEALSGDSSERLFDGIEARVAKADAVVLSDYGKGVLTEQSIARVVAAARKNGVPVLVDPKGTDYRRYRGATLVTPNRREAEMALGRAIATLEELPTAGAELISNAELDAAVITLGADGIYFLQSDGSSGRVPTMARAVFDVTGAGDTVIAWLALGLAAGVPLEGAVRLANQAAGIVVARRGAASVTRAELASGLVLPDAPLGGVIGSDELPALLADWRAKGKRIAFTNGCFDILHRGHVEYLRFAKSKGDVLLVGMNSDESVSRLKGPTRPVNPLADRMEVLAALDMVDAVVSFPEDTPAEIIEAVTPDALIKGEDWAEKGVVGREWVEQHGGEVHLAPLLAGRSTTAVLKRGAGDAKPQKGRA